MPHASLKLIPGVDQTRTEALNEAALWESNLIRFMPDRQGQGLPQKLGGWTKFIPTATWDIVRALHAWSDTNNQKFLGVGAENSLWTSIVPSDSVSIAPQYYTANIPVNISTTYGSAEVVITDANSNVSSYDSIYITTPISVGGVILSGFYNCQGNGTNTYSIFAKNVIGILTPAENTFSVTTIATTGTGPYTATVVFPFSQTIIPVGASVVFTDAGSFAGPYTVLTSGGGTFTFSTATNLGSASTGTFIASEQIGGLVATFTSTTTSQTITVTLADHGLAVGSTFPVLTPTTIGGVELYGNYIVTTVISSSEFTIAAANAPTSATTVPMNGGNAQIIYFLGQTATPPPVGYGAGGYGDGGYGTGVVYSGTGRVLTGVGIVGNGTTATATPSIGVYVTPGSEITVSGSANFNGTYTVLTATDSSFTFASASSATNLGATVAVTSWGFEMPLADQKDWALDNWGEYLIANPLGGEIFYWNPADVHGHAVVVPNAPLVNEGCFVAMPERQIVAYGSTFTGFQDPLLVRWCDIGNFTDWVGTVTNQAGSYRIPKGSKIVGGIQGPQQGLIWTDLGLWAMQYINLPLVYSFNEIASGCGLVGRKAVGTLSGTVYWMSQSQFFKLSGNGVEAMPCPVWDVAFQDADPDYAGNIRCAPNSRFNEIAWYYPTIGSNGIPTKYVKYNTLLGQWDYGTLTRTAWIDQSIFGPPIGAALEYDLSNNAVYNIYQHETSNDAAGPNGNTVPINSSFQTGYFAIQDGDLKTFVDQVWPDMKWGLYDQSQGAEVTITFLTADYPSDTPKSYSYTVNQTTQFVTPRLRARLVAIKIESNDLGSFWRVGNIRYRYQPDGKF